MPDHISRQIFKMKALERWENEGGSVCAEWTEILKTDSSDGRAQISERPDQKETA